MIAALKEMTPVFSGDSALPRRPWNSKSLLSRGLASLEQFLFVAKFERANWAAVAFLAGIIAWFGMRSFETWVALIIVCLVTAFAGLIWKARTTLFPHLAKAIVIVPLAIALGCLTVWARSITVGEVPISRPMVGEFSGKILEIQPQPAKNRDRLILAMRAPKSNRAIKVRLNVPYAKMPSRLNVGDVVALKARIMPPAPPLVPKAYDFAQAAWFKGLSGSGIVLSEVRVQSSSPPSAWKLASLRRNLSEHIGQRIGEKHAGIATALVTGDRGGISESDDQAMRDSGLAHLLSVSGLHVGAVVGAGYIVFIRAMALIPWLALRIRLPVAATVAGAVVGIIYTLISGAEVPTVRSCLGSLLVLTALALGREALSLRMLLVVAFCIMVIWPEAVIGPSFQMSFGAVLALIAFSTCGPVRAFMAPRDEALVVRSLRHIAMLLMTGIVIDLVLMPIGLFHFNRAGVYGALANVIAIPLTTFIVMPLLAGALILDVLGLGMPLWWLSRWSIELVTGTAHGFANLPGAVMILPSGDGRDYLMFIAGALWIALWVGRVRWLGLVPVATGLAFLLSAPTPDILISGDGRHIALTGEGGGQLFMLRNTRGGYTLDKLREQAGLSGDPKLLSEWPGARCNRDFCAVSIDQGDKSVRLLVSRSQDMVPERALAAACDASDIVISERWLPRSCQPRWIKADMSMLRESGGLALYLKNERVVSVADSQGGHGWWRPYAR